MAKNYFKRYIWLIDVIGRHGHITRREINDLWYRSPINEYREKEIPERTFHNHIEIKVRNSQAEYFRSLRLHDTQRELPGDEDHAVFRYRIAPTFDFKQEIISKMDDVEVLSPESFRKEIRDTVDRMAKLYEE